MYLTGVHSTDSATISAFIIHIYLPDSIPEDIINIIAAQFDDMQKEGMQTFHDQLHSTMTADAISDTFDTTFLDDEPIASGTYVTSSRMEGTPHAHVVSLSTCSPSTYGLTLIGSRHLRWTTTLSHTSIPTWIPESLRKPNLNQTPTVTIVNADRLLPSKDTCTIHSREFHGLTTIMVFRLFRAAALLTLYLPTPIRIGTQATKQYGHKHRLTIPTNVSLTTCIELDSTSR
jgi:hypothetical protein